MPALVGLAVRWMRQHAVLTFVFGGVGTSATGVVLLLSALMFSANTAYPSATVAAPAPVDVAKAAAVTGIPPLAVQAVVAVEAVSKDRTGCHVPWWLLAGVSLVESGHGTHGGASIGADFEVTPTIGGPPLDGNGYALIFEGGEVAFAVGPFQFIPGSWRLFGLDMNGDGVNDPNNYLDAALSAANHLCKSARGGDLANEATARAGIFGYNPSAEYVDTVWADASRYRSQAGDRPTQPAVAAQVQPGPVGTLVPVGPCAHDGGCLLDGSWAPYVQAALAAMGQAGMDVTIISAYRSVDEQVVLRRQNCGTSDYAIYLMNPGDCSTLTARPGESNHGGGVAVDLAWASGGGLNGPGDPAWEWLNANGAAYQMHQTAYVTGRDSVHWSLTGS